MNRRVISTNGGLMVVNDGSYNRRDHLHAIVEMYCGQIEFAPIGKSIRYDNKTWTVLNRDKHSTRLKDDKGKTKDVPNKTFIHDRP